MMHVRAVRRKARLMGSSGRSDRVLIFALELWPMITLIRWRNQRGAGRPAEEVAQPQVARRVVTISHVQALLIMAMVTAAVMMASRLRSASVDERRRAPFAYMLGVASVQYRGGAPGDLPSAAPFKARKTSSSDDSKRCEKLPEA